MAFVAIAFYFLIQEPLTETARFRRVLMLQHLKRSRRNKLLYKRLVGGSDRSELTEAN